MKKGGARWPHEEKHLDCYLWRLLQSVLFIPVMEELPQYSLFKVACCCLSTTVESIQSSYHYIFPYFYQHSSEVRSLDPVIMGMDVEVFWAFDRFFEMFSGFFVQLISRAGCSGTAYIFNKFEKQELSAQVWFHFRFSPNQKYTCRLKHMRAVWKVLTALHSFYILSSYSLITTRIKIIFTRKVYTRYPTMTKWNRFAGNSLFLYTLLKMEK